MQYTTTIKNPYSPQQDVEADFVLLSYYIDQKEKRAVYTFDVFMTGTEIPLYRGKTIEYRDVVGVTRDEQGNDVEINEPIFTTSFAVGDPVVNYSTYNNIIFN